MAENLWLRCNAWPAEERARESRRARFRNTALTDLGIGWPVIGPGHPRKRQNRRGPTPAIAPATSTAAPSCRW